MSGQGFDALEQAARDGGAKAVIAELIARLEREEQYNLLFEALVMNDRRRLGLPLLGDLGDLDLDADVVAELQASYRAAARRVRDLYLARGDLVAAFPYARSCGETDSVRQAIEDWAERPRSERAGNFESTIEIALGNGLHPVVGFRILVEERGVCDAITVLERNFPYSVAIRNACVVHLIDALHRELRSSLEGAIRQHEEDVAVDPSTGIAELLNGRRWLFRDRGCHVDDSHLRAAIRFAITLDESSALERASELCVYGMHLPADYQSSELAPFDDFFGDYRVFYDTRLGRDVDSGLAHFQEKVDAEARLGGRTIQFPAEVLGYLQYQTGRHQQAIRTFLEHLQTGNRLSLCPPLYRLCNAAGDFSALRQIARERCNLLTYAAALLPQDDVAGD